MTIEECLRDFDRFKNELIQKSWFKGALKNHLRILIRSGLLKASEAEIKCAIDRYMAI